jgi:hypothetical protein
VEIGSRKAAKRARRLERSARAGAIDPEAWLCGFARDAVVDPC